MALTDSDLMMIENLTYALSKSNPAYEYEKKPLSACRTVGEYLDQFDDDLLEKLDKSTKIFDGENSGQEWAAMIRYMKSKNEITDLKIQEATEKAVCFLNPNDNNSAIVAFRGTNGGEEWVDNVEGFNQADTKYQLEAYEYIENLPYERVTVVGHSKGGNKAQYVAIRSDKVERCVSVDGQGFSQEFIDKYGPQIEENSKKITCYSLSTDFVHILMYTLPGAQQIYIDGGDDVANIGENHSPNAIFEYYIDSNGEWHIKIDESGNAYLPITRENPSITMLHEFTTFVLNNASGTEKEKIVTFLSELLKGIFSEGWTNEQIVGHLKENREELALVLAYLIKYIKLNNLNIDDALELIKALGMYELFDELSTFLDSELCSIFGLPITGENVTELLIKIFLENISDGKEDKIIKFFLEKLSEKSGFDIASLWKEVEDKYTDLEHVHDDKKDAEIEKIDYSHNAYSTIMEAISSFGNIEIPDVSSWNQYSENGWFAKILVSLVIKIISKYVSKIQETNNEWKNKVNKRFEEMNEIDVMYAERISAVNSQAKLLLGKIKSIF